MFYFYNIRVDPTVEAWFKLCLDEVYGIMRLVGADKA